MSMSRKDIIQRLIDYHGYTTYLEIGLAAGQTFNSVTVETKHSVDPDRPATYRVRSDDFFALNSDTYDIVFIDGLHVAEQTTRDIRNALSILNEGGSIVVHDCLPETKAAQEREFIPNTPWNGDVWKAFAKFRVSDPELEMITVDSDHGCGIIKKGEQTLYRDSAGAFSMTWDYFTEHRDALMNVISVFDFRERTTAND
jgi:hypothetical protein